MVIRLVQIKDIIPYTNNPRKNKDAVAAVKSSISEYGFKVPIKIIKNTYILTKTGVIYFIDKRKNTITIRKRKARKHTNGYLRATIFGKDKYIHRLVGKYFVQNSKNYNEINHKDGNKKNDNAENLEWCTRQQNNKHAFKIGLRTSEEMRKISLCPKAVEGRKKRRIFNNVQIKRIRNLIKGRLGDRTIARIMGCNDSSIYSIRNGNSYKEVY